MTFTGLCTRWVITVTRFWVFSCICLWCRLLPPATKLRQGNVFTRLWFCSQGETPSLDRDPLNRDPLWTENPSGQRPPWQRSPPHRTETLPSPRSPYGNERAVRILLERILVSLSFALSYSCINGPSNRLWLYSCFRLIHLDYVTAEIILKEEVYHLIMEKCTLWNWSCLN